MNKKNFIIGFIIVALLVLLFWLGVRGAVVAGTFTYNDEYIYNANGVQVYAQMDDGGAGSNLGATVVKGGTATISLVLTNMSEKPTIINLRYRLPAGFSFVDQIVGAGTPQLSGSLLQWPAYSVPAGESKITIRLRSS